MLNIYSTVITILRQSFPINCRFLYLFAKNHEIFAFSSFISIFDSFVFYIHGTGPGLHSLDRFFGIPAASIIHRLHNRSSLSAFLSCGSSMSVCVCLSFAYGFYWHQNCCYTVQSIPDAAISTPVAGSLYESSIALPRKSGCDSAAASKSRAK